MVAMSHNIDAFNIEGSGDAHAMSRILASRHNGWLSIHGRCNDVWGRPGTETPDAMPR